MSVIRTIHDKNNPYLMVNKSTINDSGISFKALGFWLYAMSKPDNWTFHVKYIAKERMEGRDAIYAMIKELEQAGYCIKRQLFNKNEDGHSVFGEMEYLFFETKEQANEFKKSTPCEEKPFTEKPLTANPTLIIKDSTEYRSIEKEKINKKKDAPPSAIACSLFEFFKTSREKHLPEVKTPIPTNHASHFDLLLRVYDEARIRRVITFAHTDPFWSKHVLTPSYLKSKFDKLIAAEARPSSEKKGYGVNNGEFHDLF